MSECKAQSLYDPNLEKMDGFTDFVTHELKMNFVDLIFSELEKGEKIIGMGKIQKRMISELCQIESSLEMTVTDLVRCKDCIHSQEGVPPFVWCGYHDIGMKKIDFCSRGERK